MRFEYVGDSRSAAMGEQGRGGWTGQVVQTWRHLPRPERGGKLTTIHGVLRVSCRELSHSECELLGMNPRMRRDARFAVHVEGIWRLGSGEQADIVLDVYGDGGTPADVADAYVASCHAYQALPDTELTLIQRELLSALQLVSQEKT